ncbi:hypothetical protein PPERSA_11350 [Pseudocohnilembus persalinus]|uniref:Uncharacterized protein n=1 Tax=Pseudocohnilembus persalinus TaxID=266149 RepID=A0A0V0QPQ4_PSEPJ|nr:hypothetical protein PPERSA_11350 [Pseudocohnilembus persalinus]|eukprot:KRX04226.1 hypothetical protein PPERSA_11350 [Pseudocohnilembus persalinus]
MLDSVFSFLMGILVTVGVYLALLGIPLLFSLRILIKKQESEYSRWLLHWLLVLVILTFVWPVFNFLEGYIGSFIITIFRMVVAFGILFKEKFLGNKLEQQASQFTALAQKYLDQGRVQVQQLIKKLSALPPRQKNE